jgi:hypothetical protein
MAYNDDDDGIECDIIESYGIFSEGTKNWNKEVNLVSWNGRPAKLDIRSWQQNHEKCGKGITLTWEEAHALSKLLTKILKNNSSDAKPKKAAKSQAVKKRPVPPPEFEPFYDELELLFGAGPEKCKTARNTLLKKYHPDKNSSNSAFATRKTIKIKEAYDKIAAWWKENAPR